jgi:hypothetical protein
MRWLLAALIVPALLAVPAAASAARGGVTVSPVSGSTIVVTAAPGATKRTAVVVHNGTLLTNQVKLDVADAETAPTTGAKYLTGKVATGSGSWLTLDLIEVILAPQRTDRVALVVKVPPGTKPGQYVAGVVASTTQDQPNALPSHVRNLAIVPVQVNVPGRTVHRLRVGTATVAGPRRVLVHLENAGNVVEVPTGTATISAVGGKTIQSRTLPLKAFLPHTSIDYPLSLDRPLATGRYRVAVTLKYAGRTAAARPIVAVTAAPPPAPTSTADLGAGPARTTTGRTRTGPTKTGPTKTTTTPTDTERIAPAAGLGGGSFPWTWVVVGAVLVLLAALLWLFLRGRGGSAVVTIPLPPPLPPLDLEPPPAVPAASPAVAPDPAEPAYAELLPLPPPVEAPPPGAEPPRRHEHYWQVRYDDPVLGADGVWRFPHVCRDCGLELLARDVADASAQAPAGPV